MSKICESCNGSGYLVQPWDADDDEGILCPSCNGDGVEEEGEEGEEEEDESH